MADYKPNSHFFVDHSNLEEPLAVNNITDAYGPVKDNETTQFRTTSFVRASGNSKVFAICDGHILIQPNEDDSTKVNMILKPINSNSSIKVKYFVYRGIDKSDLISNNELANVIPSTPEFIKRVWQNSIDIAESLEEPSPTSIAADLIGFDPSIQNNELLHNIFFGGSTIDFESYNIPKCFSGEVIGNFTETIGIDIVLDYGDFEVDYEFQTFKFDLEFARKSDNILDVSNITGNIKQRQFKEYVQQFIDAAAFFGSHIDCGSIKIFNDPVPKEKLVEIYPLVSKFQTKRKLYLYLKGERGRSYNFYQDYPTGRISMDLINTNPQNLVDYNTHGWPILIKEFRQTSSNTLFFQLTFEYNLNSDIFPSDLNFSTYLFFPRVRGESFRDVNQLINTSTDSSGNPTLVYSGQTKTGAIKGFLNNADEGTDKVAVSSFFFCSIIGLQDLPLENYFNNLWIFNTVKTLGSTNVDYEYHTIDKNDLKNIYRLVKFRNIKIQQKVIVDIGRDGNNNTQRRKLFVAIISDTHGGEHKSKLNHNAFSVSGINNAITEENYGNSIYNDQNYLIYRGQIQDGNNVIRSLALLHTNDFELKQRFLQIGITEREYNKLLYNNPTIPTTLPDPPFLSTEISNIYLHLEEITTPTNVGYRKFRLGLKYENPAGLLEIKYPSESNRVEIYSVDGFCFFSSEFSQYQEFRSEFSENEVHFRPTTSWLGEFGFDWIKIGDSGLSGDTITPINRKSIENIGHYYTSPNSDIKEVDDHGIPNNFKIEKVEFHSQLINYTCYPRQIGNESLYVAPWLSLYPAKDSSGNPTSFPKTNYDSTPKCLTEVTLNLILNIAASSSITQLKLKYEKSLFAITSIDPSVTSPLPDANDNRITYSYLQINKVSGNYPTSLEIKISCLSEFSIIKNIQVISVENGNEKQTGLLNLSPNSSNNRKEVELLLVNCETDLMVAGQSVYGFEITSPFTIRNKILSEISLSLNQSLIDIRGFTSIDLDLTRNTRQDFYTKYHTLTSEGYLHPNVEHSYLMSLLPSSIVNDKLIIFCINEYCANPIPGSTNLEIVHGQAEEINVPKIILYKSGMYQGTVNDPNTSSHECLHGLGLFHSFSNLSPFTYKKTLTDNIMDYTDGTSFTSYRTTTNSYQKNIIKKNKIVL